LKGYNGEIYKQEFSNNVLPVYEYIPIQDEWMKVTWQKRLGRIKLMIKGTKLNDVITYKITKTNE